MITLIVEATLFDALRNIGYHDISKFIERCRLESGGEPIFTLKNVKDVSFSLMLAEEKEALFKELGINQKTKGDYLNAK